MTGVLLSEFSYAHGTRSLNRDCSEFCLRHGHQFLISNLSYRGSENLIGRMPAWQSYFQVIVAQRFRPFRITLLQRNHLKGLAHKLPTKGNIFSRSQIAQYTVSL